MNELLTSPIASLVFAVLLGSVAVNSWINVVTVERILPHIPEPKESTYVWVQRLHIVIAVTGTTGWLTMLLRSWGFVP